MKANLHQSIIGKYAKMTFTVGRIKENELNKTQLLVFNVHLGY